jgi:hypothetical protein
MSTGAASCFKGSLGCARTLVGLKEEHRKTQCVSKAKVRVRAIKEQISDAKALMKNNSHTSLLQPHIDSLSTRSL